MRVGGVSIVVSTLVCVAAGDLLADDAHPLRTWVKRHPRSTSAAPPSPRMGYETSYGYDPVSRLLVRYGGHNQGGGGEQNSEVWTYDLDRDVWDLREPNDAPPGVCCAQQNVWDVSLRRFLRFPTFSGSHGWQSPREIALRDSSVWTYDLDANLWRAMRPFPETRSRPLRGAAFDPHHQVTVLHGGEGARHGTIAYDLAANAWFELRPKPAPSAGISQPGFAYDAVHRVFVLFGSQFQEDSRTWTYDLRQNRWSVLDVDAHPPAAKSCPVLAADTRNGIVLCSVRGADGLETWALDVGRKRWKHLKAAREPDPSGGRNRVLLYLEDRNLFVLENRVKKEQQIWTFRYADAPAPPSRPSGLVVEAGANGVKLRWQPPVGDAPKHYEVWRDVGPRSWEHESTCIAPEVSATEFVDARADRDVVQRYRVRGVYADGGKSRLSFAATTRPAIVGDVVVSATDPSTVEIEWARSKSADVMGYHVERADVAVESTAQAVRIATRYRDASGAAVGRLRAIGPFRRLTAQALTSTHWSDRSPRLDDSARDIADAIWDSPPRPDRFDAKAAPYRWAVYAYRVVAVNRLDVESGPSPLCFTYPAAVEHVFSREEDGGRARLRWRASRGKAIRGYHVYRHDGRWNSDPIVRLTATPIAATEFVDKTAGDGTRRYEIVAVDALGQEGEPSRPVWSRREWKRFYEPYTDEWHQ